MERRGGRWRVEEARCNKNSNTSELWRGRGRGPGARARPERARAEPTSGDTSSRETRAAVVTSPLLLLCAATLRGGQFRHGCSRGHKRPIPAGSPAPSPPSGYSFIVFPPSAIYLFVCLFFYSLIALFSSPFIYLFIYVVSVYWLVLHLDFSPILFFFSYTDMYH